MKKTYKNTKTGLILELDGPVIRCSDEGKLNVGDEKTALELAEFLADELCMVERCAVCGEEPAKHKGVCGSCMSAQPALFYDLETGRVL